MIAAMTKSPFPGMDPYLEARWSNVHVLMVSAIVSLLKRSLPAGLQARPEEEVRIETIAGERLRGFRPDIAVIDSGSIQPTTAVSPGATATLEPVQIRFHRGPVVLRHIEVVDTRNHNRVVTVIEVLSPWNKLPGQLNRDYVAKLKSIEEGGASWVEIDLLRGSRSHLSVTWEDLPPERRTNYLALSYDANSLKLLGYPISIRQRLPEILIPLREGDLQVPLDLHAALERVFSDGPFDDIDYSVPPEPALSSADAEWAAELIAESR